MKKLILILLILPFIFACGDDSIESDNLPSPSYPESPKYEGIRVFVLLDSSRKDLNNTTLFVNSVYYIQIEGIVNGNTVITSSNEWELTKSNDNINVEKYYGKAYKLVCNKEGKSTIYLKHIKYDIEYECIVTTKYENNKD